MWVVVFEALQSNELGELCDLLGSNVLVYLLDLQAVSDVSLDRSPRKNRKLLEHHAAVLAGLGDELAVHPRLAGDRFKEPGKDLEQRRLATTRRAHHCDELAGLYCKIDVVESMDRRPTL